MAGSDMLLFYNSKSPHPEYLLSSAFLISKNVQLRHRSITGPICWPSPLAKEQGLRCLKRFLARVPRSGDQVGWSSFLVRSAFDRMKNGAAVSHRLPPPPWRLGENLMAHPGVPVSAPARAPIRQVTHPWGSRGGHRCLVTNATGVGHARPAREKLEFLLMSWARVRTSPPTPVLGRLSQACRRISARLRASVVMRIPVATARALSGHRGQATESLEQLPPLLAPIS